MNFAAHLVSGLIIGKVTGNYPLAIATAMLVDADHVILYYKHGALSNLKKFLKYSTSQADLLGGQKNILHTFYAWGIVSLLALGLFGKSVAITVSLAYLIHLILDMLNNVDFYPFWPSHKMRINGPIKYFSRLEFLFTITMFLIYLII